MIYKCPFCGSDLTTEKELSCEADFSCLTCGVQIYFPGIPESVLSEHLVKCQEKKIYKIKCDDCICGDIRGRAADCSDCKTLAYYFVFKNWYPKAAGK